MVPVVEREPQHDLVVTLLALLALIENARGSCAVLVNFNWQSIQLGHCLDLDVVTPNFVALVDSDVLANRPVAALVDEAHEVLALQVDVLHTLLSHNLVVSVIPVQLARHCPVQAIAIV